MGNHIYQIRGSPLNVTIFITHVLNCVMGATPMVFIACAYNVVPNQYNQELLV